METKEDVEAWMAEQQPRWGADASVANVLTILTEIYDNVPVHLQGAAILHYVIEDFTYRSTNGGA
jgi:hypothetical protein|tara:strand:+ start:337 stop:531 length:195 start_codon:yes stop_codon:yes gene_type:complete